MASITSSGLVRTTMRPAGRMRLSNVSHNCESPLIMKALDI